MVLSVFMGLPEWQQACAGRQRHHPLRSVTAAATSSEGDTVWFDLDLSLHTTIFLLLHLSCPYSNHRSLETSQSPTKSSNDEKKKKKGATLDFFLHMPVL